MTLRASIFDMDGLLIDSEIIWHRAEAEILGDLGVPITYEENRATKGMYVDEAVAYWYARYPWAGPGLGAVIDQLIERVGELVEREGVLQPGALRALDLAAARGPLALASSTPRPLIERWLGHFGLLERFASIHSADVEAYGKPHPAVFLSAATALEVPAVACLVYEDSPAGVLAAKAGRMSVVAVPAIEDRAEPAIGLADLVLGSLEELREDWLDERFSEG